MKRIALVLLAVLLFSTAAAQGKLVENPEADRMARKLFRAAAMRTIPCPTEVIKAEETGGLEYTLVCGVSTKTAEFEEFELHWQKAVKKSQHKIWELEGEEEWKHPENKFHSRIYKSENAFILIFFKHAFLVFRYGSIDQKVDWRDPEILDALDAEIIDAPETEEP